MSLILDALNKADRQRDDKEPVPNLASYHAEVKANTPEMVPRWAIFSVIGLLFAVVIVLLISLLRSPQNEPVSGVSQNAAAPIAHAPTAPMQAEEAQPFKATQPVVETSARGLPQVESHTQLAPEVAAIYANLDAPEQAPVNAAQVSPVADLYAGGNKNVQPKAERQAATRTAPSAQPRPNAPPLVSDDELQALWLEAQKESDAQPKPVDRYANIPFLHQLPESFQERIPTLLYQNHIFSPKASAVIVNGNTYKKGDVIAADLSVDDITEEALILSYLDKPFKLAALSSWVKMN